MIKAIQSWRRFAAILQAILMLGLPFVQIHGQSALRFDVPSLQLHFFGVTLWMEEFFIVLAGIIFITFLIVLLTILFGRIWCGWLCPQTVIVDLSRFVDRLESKSAIHKASAYAAMLAITAIVAADLIWYFVSPYEFIGRLLAGELSGLLWGFWIVLTAILFLNFAFLRRRFCATVCPYSKVQSVLYDDRTLVIAFDEKRKEECMNCAACVKTCPVNIDIRHGLNAACINCAECIDKCATMMGKRQKNSLIGYSFGLSGETGKLLRQNVLLIGAIVLAAFAFLLYLSFSRVTLDVTVLPNPAFTPRASADGSIVNSYILAIENRADKDADLIISAVGSEGRIMVAPDRTRIFKGESKKVTVYVTAKSQTDQGKPRQIEIDITPAGDNGAKILKSAYLLMPGDSR